MGLSRTGLTCCLVALAAAFPAQAATITLPRAQVHVTLESNGVIDVLERLTVNSPTQLVGTREIGMQRGDLFAAPSIVVDGRRFRAGDGRRAGTFRISRGTRTRYIPRSAELHSVDFAAASVRPAFLRQRRIRDVAVRPQ